MSKQDRLLYGLRVLRPHIDIKSAAMDFLTPCAAVVATLAAGASQVADDPFSIAQGPLALSIQVSQARRTWHALTADRGSHYACARSKEQAVMMA